MDVFLAHFESNQGGYTVYRSSYRHDTLGLHCYIDTFCDEQIPVNNLSIAR